MNYKLCDDCVDLHKLYWCSRCITNYFKWLRDKNKGELMKDHEIRTRQDIAKVVKHEEDLPEYFREQAGYYRRNKLQRDLRLAADVIHQYQLEIKQLRTL